MTAPESEEQRRNRELIRWREHDKERLLVVSNVATIIGLTSLAVAITCPITCTVFVITDFLFHRAWAAAFTAILAVPFVVLWYGLPLRAAYVDRKR
jgi:hypothetical protein